MQMWKAPAAAKSVGNRCDIFCFCCCATRLLNITQFILVSDISDINSLKKKEHIFLWILVLLCECNQFAAKHYQLIPH